MIKIVINRCFGGFGLSNSGLKRYEEIKRAPAPIDWLIRRDDPALVQVVEELGPLSYGHFAELTIVEIPDDACWEINEYDGLERVEESHRSWT